MLRLDAEENEADIRLNNRLLLDLVLSPCSSGLARPLEDSSLIDRGASGLLSLRLDIERPLATESRRDSRLEECIEEGLSFLAVLARGWSWVHSLAWCSTTSGLCRRSIVASPDGSAGIWELSSRAFRTILAVTDIDSGRGLPFFLVVDVSFNRPF